MALFAKVNAAILASTAMKHFAARRGFHQTSALLCFYDSYERIGKREIVGHGTSGEPYYVDRVDYPYPAIRFREDDAELLRLREKEKGDWKKLTLDEKKALYRASFCQTFAELQAPTGEWKMILALWFVMVGVGMWFFAFIRKFCYLPLPETFSNEWKEATLRDMIDLYAEPVTGYPTKWDYENNRWKA